ncbi:terminase large subunit [Listeria monocytogenes]|nr:terminase large subunit [Listeria monocytogenes]EDN9846512.1 terminase large subunit [Listeria monocytogenes]
MQNDYHDKAYHYAKAVVKGEIIASKKVKWACQRHLTDLEQMSNVDYPFVYKPNKAKRVIKFLQILPDVKTGETYQLADFQVFIVSNLYGWYYKSNPKKRRFNKAFISLARKQGKTILSSGLALYEFMLGDTPKENRQIFTSANDKKQAKISYEMIKKQLKSLRHKDRTIYNMTKPKNDRLENVADDSFVMPLSRDTGAVDGFDVLFGLVDEYGASKTDEMVELLQSGMGQQLSPLLLIISTASNDLNVPMYQVEYPYAEQVLNPDNPFDNPNYFAFVAEQDTPEEIDDENMWIKSNPILTVPSQAEIMLPYLRGRLQEGRQKNRMAKVLTKNWNYWVNAKQDAYLSSNDWKPTENNNIDITGREVYIGIDLSRTNDLSAVGFVFPLDEKNTFHIESHSFVATVDGLDNKIERDNIDYRLLAEQGFATISNLQSGIINLDQLLDFIVFYVEKHELKVKCLAYDPYNVSLLLAEIEKRRLRWELVEVRQGLLTLSEPTKNLKLGIIDRRISHSTNPLLDIAVYNAITKENNDAIMIDKKMNRQKIDPIAAVINAFSEAQWHEWKKKRRPAFLDID